MVLKLESADGGKTTPAVKEGMSALASLDDTLIEYMMSFDLDDT